MKKTPKQATLQTLDKKIDGLGVSLDKKINGITNAVGTLSSTVGTLSDTVDSLARSTKEGFDKAEAFQEEMTEFAKKTALTLFNVDSKLQTVDQRLDAMERTLGPLVHVSNAVQRELREHNARIERIEHKIGLTTN